MTSTTSELCFPFATAGGGGADRFTSSSELSSDSLTSNGRHSRISRRQIVQRTWLLNVVDEGLPIPGLATTEEEQSPEKLAHNVGTEMENDFLSYTSTADTSGDCHTYAVADPSDEVISIASSTFESSASCSSNSGGGDGTNNQIRTEVRKVCEIFERKNLKMTSHHNNNNVSASLKSLTSISEMYQDRIYGNSISSLASKSHHHNHHDQLPFKLSHPFANDKIVIEETAVDDSRTQATESARNIWPNLRRCKSMGASIFPSSLPAQDSTSTTNFQCRSSSKFPSIPLDEMPAPNIVKSVRHVFEQLEMRSSTSHSGDRFGNDFKNHHSFQDKPSGRAAGSFKGKQKGEEKNQEKSPQIPAVVNATRYSDASKKLPEASKKLPEASKNISDRSKTHSDFSKNHSGPSKNIPDAPKTISSQPKKDIKVSRVLPLSRHFRADKVNELDCEAPKFISESILRRIRSFGTSTTYFGGAMISKLVLNRQVFPTGGSLIHLSSCCEEEGEEDPLQVAASFLHGRNNQGEARSLYIEFQNDNNFQQEAEEDESCDELRRPRVVSVLPKSNNLDGFNNYKERSEEMSKAPDSPEIPVGSYLSGKDENNNVGHVDK